MYVSHLSFIVGTPTNSKLIYLPTVIVMVSRMPYFRLLKEALSGMYRLLSEEEREESFWETIEDVANKLFLVSCLPEGLLSLEVTLPGFSSPTIIMPPRGDLHLDVRLNYHSYVFLLIMFSRLFFYYFHRQY
ncbi:PREDICTED: uncharacterized protein LOC109592554 [Amphimedon queenslandica]|uniref:Uncharacterized protein n=2 Tax=Amphimedon queenslandica TaxID=400682 RepID=A0AAN0K2H6_AMPQE|nr:PREDICTED: uncharacterized protein LOC109592554 [Amphimedon queenslandica]|eukprot:XP_019863539.1 PREDICTED: uncharacterized protein LOC109592554 [Amphimedon queenslandica]